MDNETLQRHLEEMATLLSLSGANTFRIRAYENAARNIGELELPAVQMLADGTLKNVPGIGKGIVAHVEELERTGRLEALDELRDSFPPGLLEMLRVPDLGPKKVAALHEALGLDSLDALETACREDRVKGVKGFGQKSQDKILAGIERVRKRLDRRLLLAEARPLADAMVAVLAEVEGVSRVREAGSVRRWKETVHDLDIVCAAEDPEPVMDAFVEHPSVESIIGRGGTKCSVRTASGVQIDLRVVPEAEYATALHHFTGSKAHNVALRGRARERGMKVSEWGIFDGEKKLDIQDEAALYAALDLAFVPPELREDRGEIEAAEAGTLPTLVTREDLRCWVELDLGAPLTERLERLEALGVDDPCIAVVPDEVDDAVAAVGEASVLAVLSVADAARADELPTDVRALVEGGPEVELAALEAAVATDRVLGLLHPTGRRLGGEKGLPGPWDGVVSALAGHGGLLVVDGAPDRLDAPDTLVRHALDEGVKILLGGPLDPEAPSSSVDLALSVARRGWCSAECLARLGTR